METLSQRSIGENKCNLTFVDSVVTYPTSNTPPARSFTLKERLSWTVLDVPERAELEYQKKQETTDLIRETLIPRYHKRGIDFATQVRLIHRAHTNRIEHIILNDTQAQRMLMEDLKPNSRLSGRVRSLDALPINISFGGRVILCPSYKDTPKLFMRLGSLADTLFPIGEYNPRVTDETIYHYQSFFQLMYAILHPFYEVNGRTSEDLMYILSERRPDLEHTRRYISENGFREGDGVDMRMGLVNAAALGFSHAVAYIHNATPEELDDCSDYDTLLPVLREKIYMRLKEPVNELPKQSTTQQFSSSNYSYSTTFINQTTSTFSEMGINLNEITEGVYHYILRELLNHYIDLFESEETVQGILTQVDELAENLKGASRRYTLADGSSLGESRP